MLICDTLIMFWNEDTLLLLKDRFSKTLCFKLYLYLLLYGISFQQKHAQIIKEDFVFWGTYIVHTSTNFEHKKIWTKGKWIVGRNRGADREG